MSRALDDRARIMAALEAASVRTATGGQLAAPCVLIEPGDPWSEPRRMPGRVTHWRLTAIAGRSDTSGAYTELAALIDTIDTALRIPGCELPTWAAPHDVTLGGVPYAATIAEIEIGTA